MNKDSKKAAEKAEEIKKVEAEVSAVNEAAGQAPEKKNSVDVDEDGFTKWGPQKSMDEVEMPVPKEDIDRVKPSKQKK